MHECNAYCIGDIHCDLYYSSPDYDEKTLCRDLAHLQGLRVLAAQSAREAPPEAVAEAQARAAGGEWVRYGPGPASEAWLVWWQR